MARVNRTGKADKAKAAEQAVVESTNKTTWIIGLVLLAIAAAASAVLVLEQLGIVKGLPGCGEQSGCGTLSRSAWGRIPGIDWPVSYVGFGYFLAMFIGMAINGRRGTPDALRWLARLGALASFGFIILMISMQTFCQYCAIAHLANFGFWIAIEMSPRQQKDESYNGFMTVAFSFLAISAIVALGQIQQGKVAEEEGLATQQDLADQLEEAARLAAAQPPPAVTPTAPVDAGDTTDTTPTVTVPQPVFTGRYLLGPESAPVKVVMISDYQCPDCYKYENQMMQILESRDDVSLSVKHFPFCTDCNEFMKSNKHRNACWAARAVESAGILGGNDAYWEMHKWLFSQKGQFTEQKLMAEVRRIGLDAIQFKQMLNSPGVNDLIVADTREANDLGVFFTPMIFVNGVELKWYSIPQRLSDTIGKVADAIAAGTASASTQQPPTAEEKYLLDWQEGRMRSINKTSHSPSRGDPDAQIQIVVWGEYTSPPYLQNLMGELNPMFEQYPDHHFSYRVFPMNRSCNSKVSEKITGYPNACLVARAAKAASVVGSPEQAWQFHEWLIDYGPGIDEPTLMVGAAQVGLDPTSMQEAIDSPEVAAMVAEDVRIGIQMGFRGPPAIFVNGRHIPRWSSESRVIEQVFEIASKEQDAP